MFFLFYSKDPDFYLITGIPVSCCSSAVYTHELAQWACMHTHTHPYVYTHIHPYTHINLIYFYITYWLPFGLLIQADVANKKINWCLLGPGP